RHITTMGGGGGTVLRHALFTPHLFPSYFTPQVRWLPHSPQSLTTVSPGDSLRYRLPVTQIILGKY
ncbi:hypothetical protein, partial [Salmonella enterica]|uniref:hypothetical protein n=2 Tax=Salmonella enterica TaxID=28901 RepID=UPI001C3E5642